MAAVLAVAAGTPAAATVYNISLIPGPTPGVYNLDLTASAFGATGLNSGTGAVTSAKDAWEFTLTSGAYITVASLSGTSSTPTVPKGKTLLDPFLTGTFTLYEGSPYTGTAVTPESGGVNGVSITENLTGSIYSYGAGVGTFLLGSGTYYFEADFAYDPNYKNGSKYVTAGQAGGILNANATLTDIPEVSTWAMLALGFLGVRFIGLRTRKSARYAL